MDYDAKKLIKGRSWLLLLFEAIYKALGSVVIVPFCLWLINTGIRSVGIDYITPANIGYLFYPTVVLAAIAAAIIMALYTLGELAGILTCFEYAHYEKNVGVRQLIVLGFKRSRRALRPRNWGLILFAVIIVPLSNFYLSSGVLGELRIPEYISQVINETPFYKVGLIVLTLAATSLSLRFLFVFHIFFLEGKTMREAARDSLAMIRGRYIKTALSFIWWTIKVWVKVALIFAAVVVVLLVPMFVFSSSDGIYAMLMGIYSVLSQATGYVASIIALVSSYAWITSRYYAIKSEYGEVDEDKNLPVGKTHTKAMTVLAAVVSLALIVASSLAAYWTLNNGGIFDDEDMSKPRIVAHRGCGLEAPENTVAAYLKAIEANADYGELDVHWTKDKAVVLSHDDNLKSTGAVDVNIWDITLADLKKIDRGAQFSEEYKGTSYSTLEEVMSACKGKLKLIIEIKMDGHDVGIEKEVVDLIEKHGYENDCYAASLSYDSVRRVKEYNPDIKTLYFAPFALGDLEQMEFADAIGIEMTFLSQDLVDRMHRAGKPVFVWTVDEVDHIKKCVNVGVDYIISNDPRQTRFVMEQDDNDVFRRLMELRNAFLRLSSELAREGD